MLAMMGGMTVTVVVDMTIHRFWISSQINSKCPSKTKGNTVSVRRLAGSISPCHAAPTTLRTWRHTARSAKPGSAVTGGQSKEEKAEGWVDTPR